MSKITISDLSFFDEYSHSNNISSEKINKVFGGGFLDFIFKRKVFRFDRDCDGDWDLKYVFIDGERRITKDKPTKGEPYICL